MFTRAVLYSSAYLRRGRAGEVHVGEIRSSAEATGRGER